MLINLISVILCTISCIQTDSKFYFICNAIGALLNVPYSFIYLKRLYNKYYK